MADDMNEFPSLSRYSNEIKQRKSVQKSLQEEGLREPVLR